MKLTNQQSFIYPAKFMIKTQFVFSECINENKGYVVVSNVHLDQILQNQEQITVQGNQDDEFILTTEEETFKMQITQTRNTMLVNSLKTGFIYQQCSDLLRLIKASPDFSGLYNDLLTKSVTEDIYKNKKLSDIINEYGFTIEQMRDEYKISKHQLQKFLKYTDFIKIEDLYISLDSTLLTYFMRNLLLFLNESKLIQSWFTYQQITQKIEISSENFMNALAKKFHISTSQSGYRISTSSIIRFVLVEFSCVKSIFMKKQFDDMIRQALAVYLPIGVEIPEVITEVSEYFFDIKTKNQMHYYNPLLSQGTIRSRLKFMQKYKKRFYEAEIRGALYGMVQEIQLGTIMLQKFRKYGDQYQIKGITNK